MYTYTAHAQWQLQLYTYTVHVHCTRALHTYTAHCFRTVHVHTARAMRRRREQLRKLLEAPFCAPGRAPLLWAVLPLLGAVACGIGVAGAAGLGLGITHDEAGDCGDVPSGTVGGLENSYQAQEK